MSKDTKSNHFTLPFSEISKKDLAIAGGKGANLGEMLRANIPVPDGYVVTSHSYYTFLEATGLMKEIKAELKGLDVENSKKLQAKAEKIQKIYYWFM